MRRVVAPIVVLIALVVAVAWLMRSPAVPIAPAVPAAGATAEPDAATLSTGDASPTATPTPGTDSARTPVQDAEAPAFVVRGQALRAMNTPYPLARLDAQCFVGGTAEGTPDLRAELTCDADGRFEWRLPAPTTVRCLRVLSARPRHIVLPTTVVVARGDAPPQNLEVYLAPLDRVATGTVTDTDGRPLTGAYVKTSVERVACDAHGQYRIEFSTSFGAAVVAGAPGCLSERRTFGESTDADVRVDFRLRAGLRVAGRVVDAQDAPVGGVAVQSLPRVAAATTDADGRFELTDLDPDRERHMVFARAPGYVEAKTDVETKAVPPELKLVLQRGVRVEGRVLGPDGAPVGGAEVYLGFSRAAYDRLDAVAKDDGSFVFPAVGAGEHRMVTSRRGFAPDQRTLLVPEDAGVVAAEVRLQAAHFVAGRALDDVGQPAAGVRVSVTVPQPPTRRTMHRPDDYLDVEGTTAADGSFRLEGLPAGRVNLEFFSLSHARRVLPDVEVDHADVEVALQRAGTIAGRVVDAQSGEPVHAFKIRFVTPTLGTGERRGGGYGATWVREGTSFVDASGQWRAVGVQMEPGTIWGVEATAEGYAPARNTHVVAALAPDPEACVLALSRGGTVSGRVLGRNTGAPIANATVTWFADELELQRATQEPYGLLRARTDAAGSFELAGLPPGDTRLAIEATGLPRHVEGPFALASGVRVQRTILLGDGARVRGQMVDADGEPVADAKLMLRPRSDRTLRTATGETRADGSFAFAGLGAGVYDLSGYALSGAVSTCYARRLTVEADQDLELRLAPEGTTSVRGTIRGEGPVPARLSLMLLPSGEAPATRTAFHGVADGTAFELRGAPAGEYQLVVSAPDGRMGSAKVVLREGTTIEAAVTLAARR